MPSGRGKATIARFSAEIAARGRQENAENLSAILAQGREGILFDTLSYSVREIIRNVVEHSKADEFLISVQCCASERKVAKLRLSAN